MTTHFLKSTWIKAILGLTLSALNALGATFTVTNTNDSGGQFAAGGAGCERGTDRRFNCFRCVI